MEVGSEGLVILFAIIIGGYYIINMYNEKDLVQVTSSVDNEKYTVQIRNDSKEAADLIISSMEKTILAKKVTYDFERMMDNADLVSCSGFAEEMCKRM